MTYINYIIRKCLLIVILWSKDAIMSIHALPLIFVTSAALCQFWQHVGCCILLLGVSYISLQN